MAYEKQWPENIGSPPEKNQFKGSNIIGNTNIYNTNLKLHIYGLIKNGNVWKKTKKCKKP